MICDLVTLFVSVRGLGDPFVQRLPKLLSDFQHVNICDRMSLHSDRKVFSLRSSRIYLPRCMLNREDFLEPIIARQAPYAQNLATL